MLKVALGQARNARFTARIIRRPDGTCIRDYIHVADLAQAHILALAPGKQGFYNLGNGDGSSVRQVIQTCENVTGNPIRVVEKPRRPGDPPRLVASAGKSIRELGWKPKFPETPRHRRNRLGVALKSPSVLVTATLPLVAQGLTGRRRIAAPGNWRGNQVPFRSSRSHPDALDGLEQLALGLDARRDDDFRLLKAGGCRRAHVAHAGGDGADQVL